MSYSIVTIPPFDRQLKQLAKRHSSIKADLKLLSDALKQNPFAGTPIGNSCYKVRMAIRSKGKGKSGGARIITHVYIEENNIYLLSVYDKTDISNITDKEILELLNFIR